MSVKGVTDQPSQTHTSGDVMLRVSPALSCHGHTEHGPSKEEEGPLKDLPPCFLLLLVCMAPVERALVVLKSGGRFWRCFYGSSSFMKLFSSL